MTRRILVAALLVWGGAQAATPLPVTVLYKKDTTTSAERLDPAVQSALQAFDEQLLEAGFRVIQPDPKVYEALDKAKDVVVTFSPEAGYSVLLDLTKSQRPYAGTDKTYAEARIRARVYHGRNVLASVAELGVTAYKSAGASDKAFEIAAKNAVTKAVAQITDKLTGAPPPQPSTPASLLVDAGTPVPNDAQIITPTGKKWALMVGVSDFTHVCRISGLCGNSLPGVKVDMQAMKKTLADVGVSSDRMTWLFNEQATTTNIKKALDALRQNTAPDDLVYIYLSTHGMSKEGGLSGFGVPVTWDMTKENFIDFEALRMAIGALNATNIIWINDTCHSGLAAEGLVTIEIGSRDFGIAPPGAFNASVAADLKSKNLVVISSATGDQKAADLGSQGGLFSSIFSAGIQQTLTAGQRPPSAWGFFKEHLDGKVQAAFKRADFCNSARRDPKLCTQGTQQPVFASQREGKLLRL